MDLDPKRRLLLGLICADLLMAQPCLALTGLELGITGLGSDATSFELRWEGEPEEPESSQRLGLRLEGGEAAALEAAAYLELGGFSFGPGKPGGLLGFARSPLGGQALDSGRAFLLDRGLVASSLGASLRGGLGDRGIYELGALRRPDLGGGSAGSAAAGASATGSGETGLFAGLRLDLPGGVLGLLGGLFAGEGAKHNPGWLIAAPREPGGFGGVLLLELRSAEGGGRVGRLGLSLREGLGPGLALGLRGRAGEGPFSLAAEAAARGASFLGWAGGGLGYGFRAAIGLEWRPLPLSRTSLALRARAAEVFARGRSGLSQELELRARQELRIALPELEKPLEIRLAGRLAASAATIRSESAFLRAFSDPEARELELGLLLSRGLRSGLPDRDAGEAELSGRLTYGASAPERLAVKLALASSGPKRPLSARIEVSTSLALLAEDWTPPLLKLRAIMDWSWSESASIRLSLESGLALDGQAPEAPRLSLRFRQALGADGGSLDPAAEDASAAALAEGDFLDDSVPESEAGHDP